MLKNHYSIKSPKDSFSFEFPSFSIKLTVAMQRRYWRRIYRLVCIYIQTGDNYTIWTDNLIRGEFPELVDLLIAASVPSVMSDVLRMNIIARYGGIYFDTDFICLRSFETLMKQQFCTAFAGSEESNENNVFDRLVSGCLIGATPRHYLMKQAVRLILDVALDTIPPNIKTGPVFFGNITRRYNTSNECMYVYNKKPFYECGYWKRAECSSRIDEYKKDPDIYAMHLWAASWVVWSFKEPIRI